MHEANGYFRRHRRPGFLRDGSHCEVVGPEHTRAEEHADGASQGKVGKDQMHELIR